MQSSGSVLIGEVSLDAFLAFLFTFIGFLFLGNLAYLLLRRALDGRVSRGTAKWTAAVLQYGIILGGIYASARHFLAFDPTAFAASLGVLGIVIAFSSRQIIQNAIAGVLITINRPVQLEEWVTVSGRPETGPGKVQDISFTTTTLKGLDGGLVLTPNSSIITSKVINYSRVGLFEVSIPLAVPVTADLARAEALARRARPSPDPAPRRAGRAVRPPEPLRSPVYRAPLLRPPRPRSCVVRAEGAGLVDQGGLGPADGAGLDPADPRKGQDRLGIPGRGHRTAEGRRPP